MNQIAPPLIISLMIADIFALINATDPISVIPLIGELSSAAILALFFWFSMREQSNQRDKDRKSQENQTTKAMDTIKDLAEKLVEADERRQTHTTTTIDKLIAHITTK